jgi:ABC-2 type transport system permease protein
MRRSVHAEWTKLRTVPANLWTLLALAAFMVAGTALIAASTDVPRCQPQTDGCATRDTVALTLSGVHFAQLATALIAVAAVSSEFHPGVIRTTLAANPRRSLVFTAKATLVAATVLCAAAVGVLGALFAGRAVLAGRGFAAAIGRTQPALADSTLQRAALGTVLYLMLIALLSVGVAATVRHAGSAIGTVATLLYGPYLITLIMPLPTHTLHLVQRASPMTAGLAVQATVTGTGTAPLGPWAGLAVLAAYAIAALALGGTLFTIRDA